MKRRCVVKPIAQFLSKSRAWLPRLNPQVWILATGRLLCQLGSGFTLFYAPIFFVNQVGLSATQVGLSLGISSISGMVGRVIGGSLADSPQWGRRKTLVLAALVSAVGCFVLTAANGFWLLTLGNLFTGLGMGIYWPPNEAMVADLTPPPQRNEAFALTRLCDSLGLGLGVVLGGALVSAPLDAWVDAKTSAAIAYRLLFVVDGLSFVLFAVIIYWAITESAPPDQQPRAPVSWRAGWQRALGDRALWIYVFANTLFTTYLVQLASILPLFMTNQIQARVAQPSAFYTPSGGFAPSLISALFAWHLAATVVVQLPVVRWLNRFSHVRGLMRSAGLWGLGFGLVWWMGAVSSGQVLWAVAALGVFAVATAAYMPSAASTVVEMAPDGLRGVYLAVNSQCWAIGYLIGPPIGGWALDQSRWVAHAYWLVMMGSVLVAVALLLWLERRLENLGRSPN
jgi:MFS family permease